MSNGEGRLVIENFRDMDNINVPRLSLWYPKISHRLGKAGSGDRQVHMAMDGVPESAPGGGPDAGIASVDLNGAVIV